MRAYTRWIYTWRQVNIFLDNYAAYKKLAEVFGVRGQDHIVRQVQEAMIFELQTVQMLTNFYECCRILHISRRRVQ